MGMMLLVLRDPALQVLELYIKAGLREIDTAVMADLVDAQTLNEMFVYEFLQLDLDRHVFMFEDSFVRMIEAVSDRS